MGPPLSEGLPADDVLGRRDQHRAEDAQADGLDHPKLTLHQADAVAEFTPHPVYAVGQFLVLALVLERIVMEVAGYVF